MKILIHIQSTTKLQVHEALSMAFALASFEHEIQLWFDDESIIICFWDATLGKMLSSLEMYDIPPAWISQEYFDDLQTTHAERTSVDFLSQVAVMPSDDNLPKRFELTLNL